ncbi:MAG: PilT/PilU family type 4a pilus ATPase [Eubacterium sp.]|nr:PilT/PilU family type 4a pilus ATPase [Eubacterium sp.]
MIAEERIDYGFKRGCSDIHLTPGQPVVFRKDGKLYASKQCFTGEEMGDFYKKFQKEEGFSLEAAEDYSAETGRGVRYRVHFYKAEGALTAAIRILGGSIPTMAQLGLPKLLQAQVAGDRGLVLVCGPTGSGKSTTLAAVIDAINRRRARHIITIEDPVEYCHRSVKSLIHQREVGRDLPSFAEGLRAVLREDPDVILVGEMRDRETIAAALMAAETGHLVFSTLHTEGADKAVDRIVDSFSAAERGWIQSQLASVITVAAAQRLIPQKAGGRVAAFEVLAGTEGVKHLIRSGKTHMLATAMQTGQQEGMFTLAQDMKRLAIQGKISWGREHEAEMAAEAREKYD